MKKLFIIALIAFAAPAFAHEHAGEHAKKGEHQDAPKSFDKQPAPGTWARCAVSGDVFQVGPETEFASHNGRVYAFCCPDCRPDFLKNPGKYAESK